MSSPPHTAARTHLWLAVQLYFQVNLGYLVFLCSSFVTKVINPCYNENNSAKQKCGLTSRKTLQAVSHSDRSGL